MTATTHTTAGPSPNAGPTDTASLIERLSDFDGPPEQFLQQLVAVQCHVGRANGGAIIKFVPGDSPQVLATHPASIRPETAPVWLARAFEVAKQASAGEEALDASRVLSLAHGSAPGPGSGGVAYTTHLDLLPIK